MNRLQQALASKLQPDDADRMTVDQFRELFKKLGGCYPEDYPADPEERRRYHQDRIDKFMRGEPLD